MGRWLVSFSGTHLTGCDEPPLRMLFNYPNAGGRLDLYAPPL